MNVQIFGTQKSQASKKAQRFFKERGIQIHFVDLNKKPISPGEIGRFIQKFGLDALIDTEGKAYERTGLAYMRLSEEQWVAKFQDKPELLVQPLLRVDKQLGLGWKWI